MTSIHPGAPGLPPYIVVFGPSANCTLDLCPVEYSVYGYLPNLGANISFAILFGIASVVHAWMGIWGHHWFFMTCSLVGCVSAVVGYIARVLMHNDPFNFISFMIQLRRSPFSHPSAILPQLCPCPYFPFDHAL